MKFLGHGVVWDSEHSRPLCKFDRNGIFNATDERTIKRLQELGYKTETPFDVVEKDDEVASESDFTTIPETETIIVKEKKPRKKAVK